ncbi:MAG: Gfo/Idh/MocA family oxidoreductase, partial [Candidatus Firestonebacteria bacterium]
MKKVGLGIVGLLGHAGSHLKICEKLKDVKFVAGCDKSAAGRKRGARAGMTVYSDIKEMLKHEKLAAVIISTPNFTHKDISIACLKAGVKVFCEKPMAHTLADCKAMAAAANKYKGFLQIGFELRTCPVMLHIKKMVDGGAIGEVKNIHFFQTPGLKKKGWKLDPKRSGGLFIEKLCHQVDLFRYFLGEPKSVQVFMAQNTVPSYGIMDNCYAVLEFGKGRLAQISFLSGLAAVKKGMKNSDYSKMGHGLRFDFIGTKGSISYNYWEKSVSVTKLVKEKGGSHK